MCSAAPPSSAEPARRAAGRPHCGGRGCTGTWRTSVTPGASTASTAGSGSTMTRSAGTWASDFSWLMVSSPGSVISSVTGPLPPGGWARRCARRRRGRRGAHRGHAGHRRAALRQQGGERAGTVWLRVPGIEVPGRPGRGLQQRHDDATDDDHGDDGQRGPPPPPGLGSRARSGRTPSGWVGQGRIGDSRMAGDRGRHAGTAGRGVAVPATAASRARNWSAPARVPGWPP